MNKEEVISSGGGPAGTMDLSSFPLARSASTPPTPVASSAGASSPAALTNIGSIDWLGQGEGSKAGSLSCMGSQPMCTSMSASAGGSALGSSQSSCRPWERGDLLRRLATFRPANWSGKPKASSSLSCARRGWINVDIDKIECEVCSANLKFKASDSLVSTQADDAGEDFARQLDGAHRVSCPWRGNICAESLVQFPPAPLSALVGGFKDRCDGLLQFLSLPVVSASAIEQMRISRGPQIDRFLALAGVEMSREDAFCIYTRAQKLISLCGWEPRWLPLVQDCEEHSAQSARNGCSDDPARDSVRPEDPGPSRKTFSALSEKVSGKKRISGLESRCESRSPLLDCSLCGATVRIWNFLTVSRPARFTRTSIDMPETSKKLALTRGASAASGISGWVSTDGVEKDQTEDHDEAATTDAGLDLNLTMAGGLSSNQVHTTGISEQYPDASIGRDLGIGQPSSSEVGDRAASYESRGPSSRKRSLEEGGSTADIPQLRMQQHADSVEGTVIDREGDEVNDGWQYSSGNLKRARDSDALDTSVAGPSRSLHFDMETDHRDLSSYRRHSTGVGPSHSLNFDIESEGYRLDQFHRGNRRAIGAPSTRDSAHASSVIAMDTVYHGSDDDSMDSVENYPTEGYVHFPPTSVFKNPDLNETSEVNYSNQAQNSTCFQPAAVRVASEMGVSSINDGEEVLNTETATTNPRNGISFGISGGSVGMGASHEAEIHGADVSIHRVDSGAGDVEPIAEVTENQGQTGEFAPDTGLTDDFVPDEMDREDPNGDSQDLFSRSLGRADSGSKIVGSPKAESGESGDKTGPHENSAHPSLSCNAVVCSGYEASKEEVSQACKTSRLDDCTSPGSGYMVADGIGPPNGESNYEEGIEFDPIKYHNIFCPWVNGNVAAAGCAGAGSSSSSSVSPVLCGWQLTLDALDSFQSLGHDPPQMMESESTASLYKDDHLNPGRKLLAHHSFSKSRGQSWV